MQLDPNFSRPLLFQEAIKHMDISSFSEAIQMTLGFSLSNSHLDQYSGNEIMAACLHQRLLSHATRTPKSHATKSLDEGLD